MPTEKQVRKAIKRLGEAWEALEPLVGDIENDPRDSVYQLRTSINEYLTYLEDARWWRKTA